MSDQISNHPEATGVERPALPHAVDPARLGRRRFLLGAGAVAGAGALSSWVPAGVAEAALPAGASSYTPLSKAIRVADTRSPRLAVFTRVSPQHIRVQVKGRHGVPATASAVVLTLAGINWDKPNWVVAYPSGGKRPLAANLNMFRGPGEVTANLVTVKVGSGNSIDVYSLQPCDVTVDLLGYYDPVSAATKAGRFVVFPTALRALDTRDTFGTARSASYTPVVLPASVPSHASSVMINLTATECTGPGYFTAVSASAAETPDQLTSSLNVTYAGDTRGSAVIVPVETINGKRRIKIFTKTAAKLVIDVNGYYTSDASDLSTDGLFVSLRPQRILDTRSPGEIGKLWPHWVVERKVPGAAATEASAIVANVTGVESRGPGYFTVSAARRPRPPTANVNWMIPNAIVPNHVVTPVTTNHGFQVFASHGAHVVVDLAGYFTGRPLIRSVAAYTNPAPPAAPPNWTLRIPRIGLTTTVMAGDPRYVTDSGHTWHWTGTGFMGQDSHVAVFGHRTEAGGPYRYVDSMVVGDTFTVTTGDRREYTYRMVRRDLTDAQNANILQATRSHPGPTFSMVACTVGYDSRKSRYPDAWAPTSLLYRIVVTGELVSWREF